MIATNLALKLILAFYTGMLVFLVHVNYMYLKPSALPGTLSHKQRWLHVLVFTMQGQYVDPR